jgi:putative membrane protein
MALPGMLGTAISLIIAFRIAQSYDRWWEARKIWGAIVNDSRNLVRQAQTHVGGEASANEVKLFISNIVHIQIAWCYALGQSLRDQDPLIGTEKYLDPEMREKIAGQANIPNAILQLHATQLKTAVQNNWLNGFQSMLLDNTIVRLTDAMGMSERIKKTVFPRTYQVIVEFLLYLFVLMLPFGIIDFFGFFEAPLIILISLPFFLLEKTAIHLQDPFSNLPTDTPVTAIARSIEVDLNQMINQDPPEPDVDALNSFYLM